MDNLADKVRETISGGFARYVRDNPLAAVSATLIIGMLLARFAFLGDSAGRSVADE